MRDPNARACGQAAFLQLGRSTETDGDDRLRLLDPARLVEEEAELQLNTRPLARVVNP